MNFYKITASVLTLFSIFVQVSFGQKNTANNSALYFLTPNKNNCSGDFSLREYDLSITIKIKGLTSPAAYLAFSRGEKNYQYIDTFQTAGNGVFTLTTKNALWGFYVVVIPGAEEILMAITPEESDIRIESTAENITADLKVSGSEETKLIYKFIMQMSKLEENERARYLEKFIDNNSKSMVANIAKDWLYGDNNLPEGANISSGQESNFERENILTFRANVDEFTISSKNDYQGVGKARGGVFNYYLEKVKEKNLEYMLECENYIPAYVIFDKTASNKEVCVKFRHTKEYIHNTFIDISRQPDIERLDKFINEFVDCEDCPQVVKMRDSLEVFLSISLRSESGLETFIKKRPQSHYLELAMKNYDEFLQDRILFQLASKSCSIEDFDSYLSTRPRSTYWAEAKSKRIECAYTKYLSYDNTDSLIYFYTYFIAKAKTDTKTRDYYNKLTYQEAIRIELNNYARNLSAGKDSLATAKILFENKCKVDLIFGWNTDWINEEIKNSIGNHYMYELAKASSKEQYDKLLVDFSQHFGKDVCVANHIELNQTPSTDWYLLEFTKTKNCDFKILGDELIVPFMKRYLSSSTIASGTYEFKGVNHNLPSPIGSLTVEYRNDTIVSTTSNFSGIDYKYDAEDKHEYLTLPEGKIVSGLNRDYRLEFHKSLSTHKFMGKYFLVSGGTKIEYEGEINAPEDGEITGSKGKCIITTSSNKPFICEGDGDLMSGNYNGTLLFGNTKFTGKVEGFYPVRGKLVNDDGSEFEGELRDAEPYKGKYTLANGKVLEFENSEELETKLNEIKLENYLKLMAKMKDMFGGGGSENSSSTYNNEAQSNPSVRRVSSEKRCGWCNGTGNCSSCSKTFKTHFWGRNSWEDRNESRPGQTMCGTCRGSGVEYGMYKLDNKAPSSKKCYINTCRNGWENCKKCNSSGNGKNIGKCRECDGTGISR